jgi:arsenate reductase (thioredoxin)
VSDHPKRVLFVCIGNACRSQMAEAFARTYGSDVIAPASAGLSPAPRIAPDTIRAMQEKNIELGQAFPKSIRQLGRTEFDLSVNLSGVDLPVKLAQETIDWEVADPVLLPYRRHCEVRDRIERLVMELIIELRGRERKPHFRSLHTGH